MKLGNLADGDDFYGRTRECKEFWLQIADNHLILSGPRRLGKSSLINRLREQAGERGLFAKHIDVQDISSADEFIATLENEFPEEGLRAHAAKASKAVAEWLGRFRKVDVKLPGGIGGVGVEIAEGKRATWKGRADKLEARLEQIPLLILIDEFSVFLEKLLAKNPDDAALLLTWLRAWRVKPGNPCRFLFSGSVGLNALLEKHELAATCNDCHQFPLGAFREKEAKEMLQLFAQKMEWAFGDKAVDHLCARTGWLSPFYLNLLLNESRIAAQDRQDETGETTQIIDISDVDAGYERLLISRARFHHWEKRLGDHLAEPELSFAKALLTHVSKNDAGLTLAQLDTRLSAKDTDSDRRAERLQALTPKLVEEGYLTPPDAEGTLKFLSFLLRDWWSRNHV